MDPIVVFGQGLPPESYINGWGAIETSGNNVRVCYHDTSQSFNGGLLFASLTMFDITPQQGLVKSINITLNDAYGFSVSFSHILFSLITGRNGLPLTTTDLIFTPSLKTTSPIIGLQALQQGICDVAILGDIISTPALLSQYGLSSINFFNYPASYNQFIVYPAIAACNIKSLTDLCGLTIWSKIGSPFAFSLEIMNQQQCLRNPIKIMYSSDTTGSGLDAAISCTNTGNITSPCLLIDLLFNSYTPTGICVNISTLSKKDLTNYPNAIYYGCEYSLMLATIPFTSALYYRNTSYSSYGSIFANSIQQALLQMMALNLTSTSTWNGGYLLNQWYKMLNNGNSPPSFTASIGPPEAYQTCSNGNYYSVVCLTDPIYPCPLDYKNPPQIIL